MSTNPFEAPAAPEAIDLEILGAIRAPELTFIELLSMTMRLIQRRPGMFAVFVVLYAALGQLMPVPSRDNELLGYGLSLLSTMIYAAIRAGAARLIADTARGQHPSFGELVFVVQRVLPSLIAATILSGLAAIVGLALVVVPGLVLLVRYILATDAVVIRGMGWSESFDESKRLVKGDGWRIFGYVLLTYLPALGVGFAILALRNRGVPELLLRLIQIVNAGVGLAFSMIFTVLYLHLRERKGDA